MQDPVTPPDMIGAGVASPQPPGPDAASLMAQLRTPAIAAQQEAAGLMNMPRQTPGQAYAQAAAGGVSAMTGAPNPVMQQQAAQQHQIMQYNQLHQRIMDQRARREEAVLNLSKDLMNSPSEAARMIGARGQLNFLGADAQQYEPLVKAMATRTMDGKELNETFRQVRSGILDFPTLKSMHPNLTPEIHKSIVANKDNDQALEAVGLETSIESGKKEADLRVAKIKAMEHEAGLANAPPEMRFDIDSEHRRIDPLKRAFVDGTPETRAQAALLGYARYKEAAERKQALAEAESARKALKDAQLQEMFMLALTGRLPSAAPGAPGQPGPLGGGRFDIKPSIGPSGPRIDLEPAKQVSGETLNQLTAVGAMSDALNNISAIRNDPAARKEVERYIGKWDQYRAPILSTVPFGMAGKVPTSVVRLQADLKTFENYMLRLRSGAAVTASEMPRLEAELARMDLPPDQFWTMYDRALKNQDILKRRVVEMALSGSQRAKSVAMELGLVDPQTGQPTIDVKSDKKPASPLAPAVPPGAKMENGELVSESGKYVWRGGKWTPR